MKTKKSLTIGIAVSMAVFAFVVVHALPSLFDSEVERVAGVYEVVPSESSKQGTENSEVPPSDGFVRNETVNSTNVANQTGAETSNYTDANPEPYTEEAAQEITLPENQTISADVNTTYPETNENDVAPCQTNVIINQLYAGGNSGSNAVSHSFVELFNPTDERVYLGDSSVQVQTPGDPGSDGTAPPPPIPWNVIELEGYIEPFSSFLIVSDFGESNLDEHRVIEKWDIETDYEFGNRCLSVALVGHQEPLPAFITENCGVIDLLGALNTGPPRDRTDNYLIAPARISRSLGVRRVDFVNTGNNEEDFPSIRYLELSDEEWQEMRPRYSGDGAWAAEPSVGILRDLPGLIIYQAYGQGSPGRNAISHGFIELYNPTNRHINLRGFSLQVASGSGIRPWNVLELPDFTIQPQTSFLVVSMDWFNDNTEDPLISDDVYGHLVRYVIPDWDMEWDLRFNNNNMVAALVDSNEPLSNEITKEEWYGIIDLVGVHNNSPENTAHFLGSGPAGDISRQASVRRRHSRNTSDNRRDFVRVHYGYPPDYENAISHRVGTSRDGLTNRQLELVRPRYSGDGRWVPIFVPTNRVTVIGGISGYEDGATPHFATLGETVTLYADTPPEGHIFLGWTSSTPGVIIENATSPTMAYFTMIHLPVTIIANFFEPERFNITISGGGTDHGASLNPAHEGANVILNAGAAPEGTRFAYWSSEDVTILNRTQQFSASFIMPAHDITVTAHWEDISDGAGELDVVLMELVEMENDVAAEDNQFIATGGFFREVSNLTAWSGNEQRNIGFRGTVRAPIVLNNFGAGWRSVNPSVSAGHLDFGVTVDTATAFQIRFETTGHENIRFSARQRSTGSGPDFFALAYRVGSDGGFTSIANTTNSVSLQETTGFRTNSYEDLDWPGSQTFNEFRLPPEIENESVVYLRVYMRESAIASTNNARTRGNTSINDIIIIGDEIGGFTGETFDVTIIGGGANHSANPNPAREGAIVALGAGTPPEGMRFVNWTSEDVTIDNETRRNGATFVMPAANVTVTANWEPAPGIPGETDVMLVELVRTESNSAADDGNQFDATGGIFMNSNLTAWSGNEQQIIGYRGNARAPMVFNNFSPGWRAFNPETIEGDLDYGVTVDTATAFQIRFETTGYKNIRFSARQRSTGSGPDFFGLAYRIGSEGGFISIADTTNKVSLQNTVGFRRNNYSDLNWPHSQTFDEFVLPSEIANEPVVYLRLYMRDSGLANTGAARMSGNTSINDIEIIGDALASPAVETMECEIIFDAEYAAIDDENLSQTINVSGTATGEITFDYDSLPEGIFAVASGAAITISGIRPASNEPPISGSFIIYVTRADVTQPLEVRVNLTPAVMPLNELLSVFGIRDNRRRIFPPAVFSYT